MVDSISSSRRLLLQGQTTTGRVLLPLLMLCSALLSFFLGVNDHQYYQDSFHSAVQQRDLYETFVQDSSSFLTSDNNNNPNLLQLESLSPASTTNTTRAKSFSKTKETTPTECPKDTRPFTNVLLKPRDVGQDNDDYNDPIATILQSTGADKPFNVSSNGSIPKVVYFISASNCFTKPYEQNLNLWVNALQDDHSIVIINETVANQIVFHHDWSQHFPDLDPTLPCLPHQGAQSSTAKANLVRYLLLWKFGGMYVDIDNAPGPELRHQTLPHLHSTTSVVPLVLNKFQRPMNSFLRFPPGHPLLYRAMQIAISNLRQVPNVAKYSPYDVTGTHVLGMAFLDFAGLVPWTADMNVTDVVLNTTVLPGEYAWNNSASTNDNWTVTVFPANDDIVRTSVIIGHDKRVLYRKTGMSIWQKQRRRGDGRKAESCVAFLRRLGTLK